MVNEIDWPSDFSRTPAADREPYPHGFQVSRKKAFENVLEELQKFDDVHGIRIETAADHGTRRPNVPLASSSPHDPGVVAYWSQGDEDFAAPCDMWDNLRDNAQAIYHYLSAKRGMDRWGVETVESEFATQRVEKTPVGD